MFRTPNNPELLIISHRRKIPYNICKIGLVRLLFIITTLVKKTRHPDKDIS